MAGKYHLVVCQECKGAIKPGQVLRADRKLAHTYCQVFYNQQGNRAYIGKSSTRIPGADGEVIRE